MTDTKVVTVVRIENITGTKADRMVIHYEPNSPDAEFTPKIGNFTTKLTQATRELLLATNKGDVLTIQTEMNGKYSNLISATKGGTVAAYSQSKVTGQTSYKGKDTDSRHESIVFQNSMAHATAISIHNAKAAHVNVEDVLALAYKIHKVSLDPSLAVVTNEAVPDKQQEAVVLDEITKEVGF